MRRKLPEWLGRERIYNPYFAESGLEVIKWDVLRIQKKQKVSVRFISKKSEHRYAISMSIDVGKGNLTTNGVSGKSFALWEDHSPRQFEVVCYSEEGYLSIYHIVEKKDVRGIAQRYSQMDYSGMLLEQRGNIYRYSCNDATLDSLFDRFVFEIELLKSISSW